MGFRQNLTRMHIQLLSRGVLVAVLFFVFAQAVKAQSWPQHTYWSQSPLRLNPAASSNLYSLDASVSYRKQWSGLVGSPSTTQASIGAPLYIIGGGASLGVEVDEVGVHSISLLRGGFSYQVLNTENVAVSAGIGGSFRNTTLNGQDLRTATGSYGSGVDTHLDNLLPITQQSSSNIGIDLGIEIKFGETTVGASVLDFNEPVSEWEGVNRKWSRTYLFYGVSILPVAEVLDLEASALFQSDLSVFQAQFGVTGWYNNNIGLGTSLRGISSSTLDALSLLIGWKPNQLVTLAYAFDYGLSELQRANDGSHEVIVRYVMSTPIGKGKLPPVIFNPRL